MLNLILRRLVLFIPMWVGVSVLSFVIVHATPGDPAAAFVGQDAGPARLMPPGRVSGSTCPTGISSTTGSPVLSPATWASPSSWPQCHRSDRRAPARDTEPRRPLAAHRHGGRHSARRHRRAVTQLLEGRHQHRRLTHLPVHPRIRGRHAADLPPGRGAALVPDRSLCSAFRGFLPGCTIWRSRPSPSGCRNRRCSLA